MQGGGILFPVGVITEGFGTGILNLVKEDQDAVICVFINLKILDSDDWLLLQNYIKMIIPTWSCK